MGLDDVGAGIEIELPDPFEQHRLRHDPVGIAHQLLEHQHLARLEIDRNSAARHAPPPQIQLEIADPQHGFGGHGGGGGATDQHVEPGAQLRKGEGLDEIVVGAALQPLDPLRDLGHRGEEQDRRRDPAGPDHPEDRQAVDPRQHPIEYDRVELLLRRMEQRIRAVRDDSDVHPGFRQSLGEVIGGFAVVFGDQDLHGDVRLYLLPTGSASPLVDAAPGCEPQPPPSARNRATWVRAILRSDPTSSAPVSLRVRSASTTCR